ncbi:MAG TPA: FHA domain-containing protein [Acidimicrobiales bacterium]|nr:FHA domain-containing protein [Acidimicrobiales bacterium]
MSFLGASSTYAALVRPLQVLVMVVAILFFARVLRVAQVQARPADVGVSGSKRRHGQALGLKFIEPEEQRGERIDVDLAIVIGRSTDCDVSLYDNYLSSRHARVANDNGDLTVEDLGSTNGTYVNQELVTGRVLLARGDIVQVGGVLFEVVR